MSCQEPKSEFDVDDDKSGVLDDFFLKNVTDNCNVSRNSSLSRDRDSPAKKRGRPRKKKQMEDEEKECNTSDEEYKDTSEGPSTPSSGDSEEYRPGIGERIRKRKPVTYNEKARFQQEMSKKLSPKKPKSTPGRGRRSGSKNSSSTLHNTPKCNSDASSVEEYRLAAELRSYMPHLLHPHDPQPTECQSEFMKPVSELIAQNSSSGGFTLFVRSMSDQSVLSLWQLVSKNYVFPVDSSEVLQICQMLRHVWNSLNDDLRLEWEMEARRKAREAHSSDYKNREYKKMCSEEQAQIEADTAARDISELVDSAEGDHEKSETNGDSKPENELDLDSFPSMPATEFPYDKKKDRRRKPLKGHITPNCCDDAHPWFDFTDVQQHMLGAHYSAHLYACNFCFRVYATREDLLSHTSCDGFAQMSLERMLSGKTDQITMDVSYLYLACSECSLWMPIRTTLDEQKFAISWAFLGAVVKFHTCKTLVPVLVFMPRAPERIGPESKLTMEFTSHHIMSNLPMECTKCNIDYTDPQHASLHTIEEHPENVIVCRCKAVCGIASEYKMHVLGAHLRESMILADYIRYSCTMYPPSTSNGIPVVGTDENSPPSLGGCSKRPSHLEIAHDYVNHCKPLLREKLRNSVKVGTADWEEDTDDEDYHPSQFRPDMGAEEASYDFQKESTNQQAVKDQINDMFRLQFLPSDRLEENDELVDIDTIVRNLGIDPTNPVIPEDKIKRLTVNVPETTFLSALTSQSTRVISLPMTACIDMVSGGLFNKEYYICVSCLTIVPGNGIARKDHLCEDEHLRKVYSTESSENGFANCHICDASTCSISGLRKHYAMEHLLTVDVLQRAKTTVPGEAPCSLMENKSRLEDARSLVARATDIALNMELHRGKLARIPVAIRLPPVTTKMLIRPKSPLCSASPIHVNGTNGHTVTKNMADNPNQISPFIMRKGIGKAMFMCRFCDYVASSTPEKLSEHLRIEHCSICRGCGVAFSSQQKLMVHKATCSSKFRENMPIGLVMAQCGCCGTELDLPRVYNHLFRSHIQMIKYGISSGKLYPPVTILSDRVHNPTGHTPSLVQQPQFSGQNGSLGQRKLPYSYYEPPPVEVEHVCYLCGFEYEFKTLLDAHLEKHSEESATCRLCPGLLIGSHSAMKEHLTTVHFTSKDDGDLLVCNYCMQVINGNMQSHVLYACAQTRQCALCDFSSESSPKLIHHRSLQHTKEIYRFFCTKCHVHFYHVDLFRSHSCRINHLPCKCSCGNGVTYANRTDFYVHFTSHISKYTCHLCNKQFPNHYSLSQHRNSHGIVLGRCSLPKMVVVDSGLIISEITAEQVRQMSAEHGKPKHIDETAAFKADIEEAVCDMVREVCTSMGEADESPPSNSPLFSNDDDITCLNPLDARIRTEDSSETAQSSQHPGYVEDDDDIEILTGDAAQLPKADALPLVGGSPVVREVHDDTGDDELQVVAEVENVGCAVPSALALSTRVRTFKCDKCSLSFFTKRSLVGHSVSAHSNDAGGIIDKVFGLPIIGQFYLCRICCVVFECPRKYREHFAAHGPNSSLSCADCSAISYNMSLLNLHRDAHVSGKLTYSCSTCLRRFTSEALLMYHLSSVHKLTLLFFCKICGLTSYSINNIHHHLTSKQNCQAVMTHRKYASVNAIGICPASQVHFQPKDVLEHENLLLKGSVTVVTPSDCVHRSFLSPVDAVISCKQCHCTMNYQSFLANYSFECSLQNRPVKELLLKNDLSKEYPFVLYSSSSAAIARTNLHAIARAQPQLTPQQIFQNRNSLTAVSRPSPQPPHQQKQVFQPRPRINQAPISAMSYSFERAAPAASPCFQTIDSLQHMTLPVATVPTRKRIATPTEVDCIVLDEDVPVIRREPMPIKKRRLSNAATKPVESAPSDPSSLPVGKKSMCKVCHKIMDTSQVARLHGLHLNGRKWFCLDCANAHKSEVDAIRHFFCTHVAAAREKEGADFRHMKYALKCPIPSCNAVHSTLNSFKKHLFADHVTEAPYLSACCTTRFCTEEARDKHDAAHEQFEEINGVEGMCCPLCGIASQWTLQADGGQMLSHMAVHGLRKYSMCRDCFTCFAKDVDSSRITEHFETQHCKTKGGLPSIVICTFCKNAMKREELKSHVVESHLVYGYKSRATVGQLEVRVSEQTRQYYGIFGVDGNDSDE